MPASYTRNGRSQRAYEFFGCSSPSLSETRIHKRKVCGMVNVSPPQTLRQTATIAIAWASATAVALLATNLTMRVLPSNLDAWMVFLGAPILLGTFQWTVLRRLLPHAWWWILLMPIGCGLGWVGSVGFLYLTLLLSETFGWVAYPWGFQHLYMAAAAAAAGLGIGIIQWLYLRCFVRRAAWWLLGSAIALGIGAGFNLDAGINTAFASDHSWLLSLSIGGLLGGGIKGATLAWLVRQRR